MTAATLQRRHRAQLCTHSVTETHGNQYDYWTQEHSTIYAEVENQRLVHGLESYCLDCFADLWWCDCCGWNEREHDFASCYFVESLARGGPRSHEPE